MPGSINEKYKYLEKAFPEVFPYLFDSKGEPNDFGNMAIELLQLRKKYAKSSNSLDR